MNTSTLLKNLLRPAVSAGVLATGFASAQITTTTVVDETSFVNTGGVLVSSANFGEAAVIVNGLPHGAGSGSGTNLTSNIGFEGDFRNDQTGLPEPLETLFSGIAGAGTLNLTVSGLDNGKEYLFQAYWEAGSAQTLSATIEGVTLSPITDQPTGVIVSYTFTPNDNELNATFTFPSGGNAWLSGYSLQETTAVNPSLVETYPLDDAPDMLETPNLVATFDVTPVAGTGNITIYNSNDTVFEQIPANDTGRVTYSGLDVIIDPTADLVAGNDYYVLIDSDAITGVTGLPYAGIPTDKTAWNFSVISLGTLAGQLGVLDLTANGGINPATGVNWQEGDTYRLIFLTSQKTNAVSTDITTYNDFVQGVAASSTAFPKLDYSLWKIVGSTTTVDARDNTGTNPGSGTGVAIFLTDGVTAIATSNADLWDNSIASPVDLDENGVNASVAPNRAFTGSNASGVAVPVNPAGDNPLGVPGGQGVQTGSSNATNQFWMISWKENINTLVQVYAMSDPLTVVNTSDTTPPLLSSIVDDKGGTSVEAGQSVLYTVTFDKPMSAGTVDVSDFENQLATAATIDSVSPTANPAVYEVSVGTSETGSLLLQIKQGADLRDLVGNALDTTGAALPDDTTLTVTPDVTKPTLTSITDNVSGGPIVATKTGTPVYTVTFSEAIDPATVGTDDFENGSDAPVNIDSASPTANPAVFEVVVTTSGPGDLILQIKQNAVIKDTADNALDTGSAIPDLDTIVVDPAPELAGELGVFDVVNANGGINPATGVAWAENDTYRLVFITAGTIVPSSTDIATYNAFAQAQAASAGLGGATWNAVGSTATDDARDNTGTNPGSGTGVPVFLMDGATQFAANNADLWNGANVGVQFDQTGAVSTTGAGRVLTGSVGSGIADATQFLGVSGVGALVRTGGAFGTGNQWMIVFSDNPTVARSVYAMSEPLTVQATGNNFANWISDPAFGIDPGLQGFGQDADGDGIDNGVEAWFGTNPGIGNAGLTQTGKSGNVFSFEHPEADPPLGDVTGSYEWSIDLVAWNASGTVGDTTVVITATPGGGTTTVEADTTGSTVAPTKLFVRAVATQN